MAKILNKDNINNKTNSVCDENSENAKRRRINSDTNDEQSVKNSKNEVNTRESDHIPSEMPHIVVNDDFRDYKSICDISNETISVVYVYINAKTIT